VRDENKAKQNRRMIKKGGRTEGEGLRTGSFGDGR